MVLLTKRSVSDVDQSPRMVKTRTTDYLTAMIFLGVTERMTDEEVTQTFNERLGMVTQFSLQKQQSVMNRASLRASCIQSPMNDVRRQIIEVKVAYRTIMTERQNYPSI